MSYKSRSQNYNKYCVLHMIFGRAIANQCSQLSDRLEYIPVLSQVQAQQRQRLFPSQLISNSCRRWQWHSRLCAYHEHLWAKYVSSNVDSCSSEDSTAYTAIQKYHNNSHYQYKILWSDNRGWKASSNLKLNLEHLTWVASALPVSYGNWITTKPSF